MEVPKRNILPGRNLLDELRRLEGGSRLRQANYNDWHSVSIFLLSRVSPLVPYLTLIPLRDYSGEEKVAV